MNDVLVVLQQVPTSNFEEEIYVPFLKDRYITIEDALADIELQGKPDDRLLVIAGPAGIAPIPEMPETPQFDTWIPVFWSHLKNGHPEPKWRPIYSADEGIKFIKFQRKW